MSALLYASGLWYYSQRGGRAKLHGRELLLHDAPRLPGVALILAEIEYVPEVHVVRLREKFGGWRDMEIDEIRAADALLRQLFPQPPEA